MVFKINSTGSPSYLYNKLVKGSDTHERVTRNREFYTVPKHKSAMFQRSFSYNSVKVFNSFSSDIKSATSLTNFKLKLKNFIISQRN